MAFKDRRRTDARDNLQGVTYWLTSAEINVAEVGGAGSVVLFTFPDPNSTYIVEKCALDVTLRLDAGSVTIGHGSLPLDTTAESGTLTTTTADSLWATALADETAAEIFDIYSLSTAGSLDPMVFVGAASTVPAIIATITTAATGKFRVHLQVTKLPSY